MWLMLQQEAPDDYVVGTGEAHTVREFVELAFAYAGLDWKYVEVDPRYFRPAEVDYLLADASKARRVLGWEPTVTFEELVRIMVEADMNAVEASSKAAPRRFSWPSPPRAGMMSLPDKRIVVTGGAGFLGSHLVGRLSRAAAGTLRPAPPRIRSHPRRRRRAPVRRTPARGLDSSRRGGRRHRGQSRQPGPFFYENAIMGIQLIEAARRYAVEKTVVLGTICAYPKFTPGAVSRGRPLERLSGRDQRALRHRQEGAAGAVPGVPRAVRHERHLPAAGEPLRPAATISTWNRRTSFPR